jgi:hypothetical protein
MKSKKKDARMQVPAPQKAVTTVPFSALQPGERFTLPNDSEPAFGVFTKAGPGGFTSFNGSARFNGNARSEAGGAVNVGRDFPVERIKEV